MAKEQSTQLAFSTVSEFQFHPPDVLGENHSPYVVAVQTGFVLEALYFNALPSNKFASEYLQSHTLPFLDSAIAANEYNPQTISPEQHAQNHQTFNFAKLIYGHMATRRIGSKYLQREDGRKAIVSFAVPQSNDEFTQRFKEIQNTVKRLIHALNTNGRITHKSELLLMYEFFDAAEDFHIFQALPQKDSEMQRDEVAKSLLSTAVSDKVIPPSVEEIERLAPSRTIIAQREVSRITGTSEKAVIGSTQSLPPDRDEVTVFFNKTVDEKGSTAQKQPPRDLWQEAGDEVIKLLGLPPDAFDKLD